MAPSANVCPIRRNDVSRRSGYRLERLSLNNLPSMIEFLHNLSRGPSSLAGWLLLAPCALALIVWFAVLLSYGDDAAESDKEKLGTGWCVFRHYAPASFVRFTPWFFLVLVVIYVLSVFI